MLRRIALLLLLIAPMSVFAQKFGYVKSLEIVTLMPEYAKAQADNQLMETQYKDEMARLLNELTKKFTEYQQEVNRLPKNILERRQKELQDLNEKGMQFQQEAQQLLQRAYEQSMEPLYKKFEEALKVVGKDGGFTYIMDLSRTDIPYINEEQFIDVTADVKAVLGIQ